MMESGTKMKLPGGTPSQLSLEECLKTSVTWFKAEGPSTTLWRAETAGETWTVRVNDFPEECLYTLFINGLEAGSFDEWPRPWVRA
jgi:hypothetical protein